MTANPESRGHDRPIEPESPATADWRRPPFEDAEPVKADTKQIGVYRILDVIGRGGMGEVLKAEQPNPKRIVALKIIRPGVVGGQAAKRFAYEIDALARVQHPNIAQIFDAGKAVGADGAERPFFVMEYVEGEPLTDFVFRRDLSIRQRLQLLQTICNAVNYAHQQSVIHRDLKPSNILVTADGTPKILDFGLARITAPDVYAVSMETDIGQILGTLPYMSPEQASGDPRAMDTRTDVYSLGVIAYQLLTNTLPYQVSQGALLEAIRIIQEVEPQPLSSLNRSLSGDVETIVAKALTKEKARRYQSAADFAADIDRFLNDQPILARPPSAWYQLKKFATRNRVLVGGAMTTLLCLVIGIVGTSSGLYRALKAETRASSKAAEAELAANNEAIARQLAEEAADRERLARIKAQDAEQLAQAARREAEQASHESNQRLVAELLHDGNSRREQGDELGALLSFVEAMQSDENAEHLSAHQDRVTAVHHSNPRLTQLRYLGRTVWRDHVAFSDDGSRVVIGGLVLDAVHGTQVFERQEGAGDVVCTGISDDGTAMAVATRSHVCEVYELGSGKQIAAVPFDLKQVPPATEWTISHIDFSQDKSRLFAVGTRGVRDQFNSRRGEAVVWQLSTNEELARFTFEQDVSNISVTSDGQYVLAELNEASVVQAYSVATGDKIHAPLKAYPGRDLPSGTVPIQGTTVMVGSRMITTWDLSDGTQEPYSDELRGYGEPIRQGNYVAQLGSRGIVWLSNGPRRFTPLVHATETISSITLSTTGISPSDTKVIVTADDREVYVWNANSNRPESQLRHPTPVVGAGWAKDHLITVTEDGLVRTWGFPTAHQNAFGLVRLPLTSIPQATQFSRDGRFVLIGCSAPFPGATNSVTLFDIQTAKPHFPPLKHTALVFSVAYGPDGTKIATGCQDGSVRIFSATDGALLQGPFQCASSVMDLSFSADGRRLMSVVGDHAWGGERSFGEVQMWDLTTGKPAFEPIRLEGFFDCVDLSPDGKRLLLAQDGVQVHDVDSGEELFRLPAGLDQASFHGEGTMIAARRFNTGEYVVFDCDTRQPVQQLSGFPSVKHFAFDAMAEQFAVSTDQTSVRVWEVATGEPITDPLLCEDPLAGLFFTPDGRFLVTAGNKSARIWEVATGEVVMQTKTPTALPVAYDVSHDGRSISLSGDIIQLPGTANTEGDVTVTAQLLSGQRYDRFGGRVTLSPQEMLERWDNINQVRQPNNGSQ